MATNDEPGEALDESSLPRAEWVGLQRTLGTLATYVP